MAEKSLKNTLEFFDESGEDDNYRYYDIKPGFQAFWKHDEIVVIGIPLDPAYTITVHTQERGELPSTENVVANLDVYKSIHVY